MATQESKKFLAKPFDELTPTELENRKKFDCGEQSLNEYIQKNMRKHDNKNISKSFIYTDGNGAIVGYYTITIAMVDFANIPTRISTTQKYPTHQLPVISLARLAIDKKYQGQKFGSLLLAEVIAKALSAVKTVGGVCLVVEALHERAAAFYRAYGFESSPSDPLHLYLGMV